MHKCLCLAAVSIALVLPAAAAENSTRLFHAIREGDIAFVKAHLDQNTIETRDRRGATPLMHAAAFGNIETLRLLLDTGADVNARNDFDATALLWCARDPERVRLLVERGADVNAQSKQGRTPLMVASLRRGGADSVELMLAKGAGVNSKDSRGDSAIGLAASIGDVRIMRRLLAAGADVNAVNKRGMTPVNLAASGRSPEAVRLLIEKGADVRTASNTLSNSVRHGQILMIKLAPLHRAAAFGPAETVRDLLKAGADVNARDGRKLMPLSFAVATDNPSLETVRLLLQAGADVNAGDNTGETALDWAEKFGYPDIITALKRAGGKRGVPYAAPKPATSPKPEPAVALARSMSLLQKTSARFFKQSGCVGCHHQPLIARVQPWAKAAGAALEEPAMQEQVQQMKGQWLASQEEFLQTLNPGGGANRLAETLLGLEAAGYPADVMTDSAIVDLAESQALDGSWPAGEEQPRPPITESLIATTTRAIRAIQAYSIPARRHEFAARVDQARKWLRQAKPRDTDDFAMRLSGLAWSGGSRQDLLQAAKALIALQHSDGGWSGNRYGKSDAFATGEALTALAESGVLSVRDSSYRRGVDYLLSTQYPDGSWYVRSRSIKFQPFFESGFPFGHDQWISTAATAWASQAIALSMQPAAVSVAASHPGKIR